MAKTDAEEVVDRFLATWPRGEVEEWLAFFADDAINHNVPLEPAVGMEAIHAHMHDFLGFMDGGIRPEVHHQVSDGTLVMNERTDHYEVKGQPKSLAICGVFEIEEGRIKRWREYFDLSAFSGP